MVITEQDLELIQSPQGQRAIATLRRPRARSSAQTKAKQQAARRIRMQRIYNSVKPMSDKVKTQYLEGQRRSLSKR